MQIQKKDPRKECLIRNRVKQVQRCSSVRLQLLQPAEMHLQLSSLYGVCYIDAGITFVLYKRLKSACHRIYWRFPGHLKESMISFACHDRCPMLSWSTLLLSTGRLNVYQASLRSFQLPTFCTLKNSIATITLSATYSQLPCSSSSPPASTFVHGGIPNANSLLLYLCSLLQEQMWSQWEYEGCPTANSYNFWGFLPCQHDKFNSICFFA